MALTLLTFAGTPVYPCSGGLPEPGEGEEVPRDTDEDQNDDEGDDQGDPGDDSTDDDEELGPAGKKALEATREERDREKGKAKAAREALKPWSDLMKRFGPIDQITARLEGKVKDADGREVDVADLRREIEAEVAGRYQGQLNDARIQTIASETFTNPADALAFVDRSALEPGSDGTLDEQEVRDALAEVLAARPYLAKSATPPARKRTPSGGRGQGNGDKDKPAGSVQAGWEAWNAGKPKKQTAGSR